MFARKHLPVWIGIILLSGMFLMGQDTWAPAECIDNDGDGYGNPASSTCTYPALDCDDADADVNPGAAEICDNVVDDDCDGLTDGDDPACGGAGLLPDTAQDACYNNSGEMTCPSPGGSFYGQDAQYDGNPPSYTVSGDGLTVYDNNTGLTWMQSADLNGDGDIDADDKLYYADALTYPDTLNAQDFGGYSDWRVPTIKELYSLMDFRGTDPNPMAGDDTGLIPFIDTNTFAFGFGDMAAGDRVIDSQWVTDAVYTDTVMNGEECFFGVNFADGRIKCYPTSAFKTYYARYVRGPSSYGVNSFTDNGNGTVTDDATGFMWAQSDSGQGMNWEDALAYCEDLTLGGYNDWRLPNAKDLQSIVDYTRSPGTTGSPAIDPVFNTTAITNEAGQTDYPFFWTGTSHLRWDGSADRAAYIAFGRGLGSMDGVNVIDVHGAGCQRSDPKDGDPDDYPTWGFGPQGDVQRVFNYVRCVRGG